MSKEAMKTLQEKVDAHLAALLFAEEAYNEPVIEAMRYSLLAGGKRMRPLLVLAAARAVGVYSESAALSVAAAVECIHTYSLIHDDLPGMDNDDLRRGKPTNHVVFGEGMAILAGDGLLTEAFSILSGLDIEADRKVALIQELATGAGHRGMVGGQAQDILSENKRISEGHMTWIHRHKTGALILASCRMGGILAGAGEEALAALTKYGKALGLAFQITDDVLDVVGDEALLGKRTGADEKLQKATYPSLYGLEASKKMAREASDEARAALSVLQGNTDILDFLADYIVSRNQ